MGKLINDLKCEAVQKAVYAKLYKGHKPNEWEPWNTPEVKKLKNGMVCRSDVKYGDNYYGTLRSEIRRLNEAGKIVVLIIEVRGALNVKRVFPEAESIFILPPSIDVLRERILGRGQNTVEETEKRLRIAEQEMLEKEKYDHRVINDKLEDCVNEVADIIRKGVCKE